MLTKHVLLCLYLTAVAGGDAQITGSSAPQFPPVHVTQSATGFDATVGDETMRVTVCADSVIHVVTRPHGQQSNPAQP
jgi:hypothetical protein